VNALSGGQQQRVAIARAVVNHPKVLLLDEPLAALDLKLRKDMQAELKRIQQDLGITFVYVTHDQEEALSMSDTVVVMKDGEIHQVGTPQDIYNEPKNAFIADFIGESNILDGIMHHDFSVSFEGAAFECVDRGFAPDQPVDVVIRPEDVAVTEPRDGKVRGTVVTTTFKGVHYEIIVDTGSYMWMIHSTKTPAPGTLIGMSVAPDDIHVMHKSDIGLYSDLAEGGEEAEH
jgi:spermidine/putrescine transport system ATP-binding protein